MPNEARMRVKLEDARILPHPFKNFSGRAGMYNKDGNRNFCVALPVELAEKMVKDGWNVKFPDPRGEDEDDVRDPYIQVGVRFDVLPPKIIMITSTGRTVITDELVSILDSMDFANVDLIFQSSQWTVGDKTGIKAYLKTMYVTIDEDDLDRKYADPMED